MNFNIIISKLAYCKITFHTKLKTTPILPNSLCYLNQMYISLNFASVVIFSFLFTVVYSIVRPTDDPEKLKVVQIKKLSPHRESIRCLINVAGWFYWFSDVLLECHLLNLFSCLSGTYCKASKFLNTQIISAS